MTTSTDEKRYLTDLMVALRLRSISGVRIGEIIAEVDMHTAESGRTARESFGPPKEYARQFEPLSDEPAGRQWGRQAWAGALTSAIGAWLLSAGAFAGMTGQDVMGLPGWWASAIGAAVLVITFSLIPIDAIVDPRRPASHRYGRRWLMSWVAGAIAVVVAVIVALMALLG